MPPQPVDARHRAGRSRRTVRGALSRGLGRLTGWMPRRTWGKSRGKSRGKYRPHRPGHTAAVVFAVVATATAVIAIALQVAYLRIDQNYDLRTVTATQSRLSDAPLPAGSGSGRRIVFDQSDQRVWLVAEDNIVLRTYLVSGSTEDNLQPGEYQVLSRQRHATAFDASGTMEYFVRFTTGANAPIGFHTVPVDHYGRLEQTEAQLGTPRSAGCVRQWREDAMALWAFAPIGTTVIVIA